MAATATIAFRVKPEIKKQADELFAHLGMTTSTGMNVLLMQTLRNRGFNSPVIWDDGDEEDSAAPVQAAEDSRPNEETLRAIKDLDENRNLSRYASVDEMLEDVL